MWKHLSIPSRSNHYQTVINYDQRLINALVQKKEHRLGSGVVRFATMSLGRAQPCNIYANNPINLGIGFCSSFGVLDTDVVSPTASARTGVVAVHEGKTRVSRPTVRRPSWKRPGSTSRRFPIRVISSTAIHRASLLSMTCSLP